MSSKIPIIFGIVCIKNHKYNVKFKFLNCSSCVDYFCTTPKHLCTVFKLDKNTFKILLF